MLMAQRLPYDSDEGRSTAAAITSLMTGRAYETSARTASRMGPFAGYAENAEHMLRVLEQHRAAAAQIDETRSEEHTSELQSLMRISYAVFCLKKKKKKRYTKTHIEA